MKSVRLGKIEEPVDPQAVIVGALVVMHALLLVFVGILVWRSLGLATGITYCATVLLCVVSIIKSGDY